MSDETKDTTLLPVTTPEPLPSSPFSPEKLQAAVDRVLATLPEGKTQALVAYANLRGEWHLAYAHRIGDQWILGGSVGRTTAHGLEGEVVVQWSR